MQNSFSAGPEYEYPLDKKQLLQTLKDKNHIVFKAIENSLYMPVGHCQLMYIDLENKKATISRMLIRPDMRGFGYGYAMLKELINYGSKNLNLKRFDLMVFAFNAIRS